MNEPKYTEDFERALLSAKGGLIVFLLTVSIVYQVATNINGNVATSTFLKEWEIIPPDGGLPNGYRALLDALVGAFLGAFSSFLVMVIRTGELNPLVILQKYWFGILTVFVILFLFSIAQESSGFNRYLAASETAEGNGQYAFLDEIKSSQQQQDYRNLQNGGDPFIVYSAYTCILVLVIFVIVNIYFMIKCTLDGYNSGDNDISKIKYGIQLFGTPYASFALELLIVVLLNMAAPILSVIIRGDEFTTTSYVMAGGIGLIALILQFMLQYNKFLNLPVTNTYQATLPVVLIILGIYGLNHLGIINVQAWLDKIKSKLPDVKK
jgi:hypothetical protein